MADRSRFDKFKEKFAPERFEKLTPEIEAKLQTEIPVTAQAIFWLYVIGHLDVALALPLPQVNSPMSDSVRQFVEDLRQTLADEGIPTRASDLIKKAGA